MKIHFLLLNFISLFQTEYYLPNLNALYIHYNDSMLNLNIVFYYFPELELSHNTFYHLYQPQIPARNSGPSDSLYFDLLIT